MIRCIVLLELSDRKTFWETSGSKLLLIFCRMLCHNMILVGSSCWIQTRIFLRWIGFLHHFHKRQNEDANKTGHCDQDFKPTKPLTKWNWKAFDVITHVSRMKWRSNETILMWHVLYDTNFHYINFIRLDFTACTESKTIVFWSH